MSDSFDFSDVIDNSSYNTPTRNRHRKVYKRVSTSDFILVLLLIFLSVAIGVIAQNRYYR